MNNDNNPPTEPTDPLAANLCINFVTLGCPKNLVDSEKMLGLLTEAGILLVDADAPADATIINTCGFIADARTEALENIDLALEQKRNGRVRKVIVAGCLAQHWGKKLLQGRRDIDAVIGLAERDNIAAIVRDIIGAPPQKPQLHLSKRQGAAVANDQVRLRLTEPSWSYLRISEGCNQGCTFCTIPAIRGPFRSKTPDAILAEATELINDGAVELNLIGQETTDYGKDINYTGGLAQLLQELNKLEGLHWLRVLYAHPATMTDACIAAMTHCQKVVPYLDLPLQHINDRILKAMHRRITRAQTEKLITKLRKAIPNITLRTSMLVGFPSETDAEFTELLDFTRATRFEALGAFAYSPEEGTPAAHLPGQIPDEVKLQRRDQLMLAQQPIAFELADACIGSTIPCLITGQLDDDSAAELNIDPTEKCFIGRHQCQAPEIDSLCYIITDKTKDIPLGTITPVKITARADYDLIAKLR